MKELGMVTFFPREEDSTFKYEKKKKGKKVKNDEKIHLRDKKNMKNDEKT